MPQDFAQVQWNQQLEDDCRQLVRLAVREDLDRACDWTTVSLVDGQKQAEATIVSRQAGVLSGLQVAELVVDEMQADVRLQAKMEDGQPLLPKSAVATLAGSARDILTCERIILNFLGRLSGIATLTAQFVAQTEGTKARIYDTRKTTPGWRRLEKLAVGHGGGRNHRVGLFAAVMIKDNHLAFSKTHGLTPAEAVRQSREFVRNAGSTDKTVDKNMIVEVEVDTFQQLQDVIPAAPDLVLLDNMSCDQLRQCVSYRDQHAAEIELEASGGVNLSTVADIARTGVDRISVGALTHSATVLDIGLDWHTA